ncbi:hypothetical protein O6H91_12G065600 [Diphasiastrum complanatum]|uniref:Uncharacterized protein n=1 Tax=Diphasiastrum complanatum TaxID=34168 RepID=A0ACC2C2R6_DIPCM|nr:hypothetical protein O6H91_12G065600 [Diphasiastrum complanatum]
MGSKPIIILGGQKPLKRTYIDLEPSTPKSERSYFTYSLPLNCIKTAFPNSSTFETLAFMMARSLDTLVSNDHSHFLESDTSVRSLINFFAFWLFPIISNLAVSSFYVCIFYKS